MSQGKLDHHRQYFKNLPPEITIEILSRLPVKSVAACKFVCKSWLGLLTTREFAKSHLAKALPGLAVNDPDSCAIYDFNDEHELDLELPKHELHYSPVLNFQFINYGVMQGSSNGIILFCYPSLDPKDRDLVYLVNPITFEYIQIASCEDFVFKEDRVVTYGFGESSVSSQLKVVRVYHDSVRDDETEELLCVYQVRCHVYTLGMGSWRMIHHDHPLKEFDPNSMGAFLHGNLHWLEFDLNGKSSITCFDLEVERFSFLPSPDIPESEAISLDLHVVEGCLCLSDNVSEDEFVVWFMRDYRGDRIWTKDLVFSKHEIPYFVRSNDQTARPVKIFKDGDILMIWGGVCFFYYSSKTRTTTELGYFGKYTSINAVIHTSSFLSLKSFGCEKVRPFRW